MSCRRQIDCRRQQSKLKKRYICVLILICTVQMSCRRQGDERLRFSTMCPHTTIYVSACYYICVLILLYVSSYYSLRVYVSSYYYISAGKETIKGFDVKVCPLVHCYICVPSILQYMCPHATCYICVLIRSSKALMS
jgi:hypothetical protein